MHKKNNVLVMENEEKKEKENKYEDDRKGRRGREIGLGEFGPPLWVSVSPVSSTGSQQTTEKEVDGKKTQEVVDEKFLELVGWLSSTCL